MNKYMNESGAAIAPINPASPQTVVTRLVPTVYTTSLLMIDLVLLKAAGRLRSRHIRVTAMNVSVNTMMAFSARYVFMIVRN